VWPAHCAVLDKVEFHNRISVNSSVDSLVSVQVGWTRCQLPC
jgi:hypothetical protein